MRLAACILFGLVAGLLGAFFLNAPDAHAGERGRSPELHHERFRCSAEGIPDRFDEFFLAASKRHMPPELRGAVGACIMKAICWIESRHREDAVSGVGAVGFCQVMPQTAEDLKKRNKWRGGNLREARYNVQAGAAAFRNFWDVWYFKRTTECRTENSIATYNAGPRNMIDAQTEAESKGIMARCWEGIRAGLPAITGRHAWETINYVDRFWSTWRRLRGYGL